MDLRRGTHPRRTPRAGAALAALAVAGLVLTGCSAGTDPGPAPTAPATAAAPASPSTPASTPPSTPESSTAAPSTSSTPGASGSAAPVSLVNPCDVIDEDEMSELTDLDLTNKSDTRQGGIEICQYSGARTVPPVLAVAGPLPGDIDNAVKEIQQVAQTADVASIEVEGADDARSFTGTAAGATQVYVIASKGQVVYGGILTSLGGADGLQDKAVAIAERLIRG